MLTGDGIKVLTIQAGYEGSDIATRVGDYAVFSAMMLPLKSA